MSEPRRPAVDLGLDRRDDVQRDVDDEIALHLELRVAQLIARGMTEGEARRAALERFGPFGESRAQLISTASTRNRRMRLSERLEALSHDLGYSLRQLRRSPGFSVAVIATLGLGIGANATMFGAIDQLLLRAPAHVSDPARVVSIDARFVSRDATHTQQVLSYPIYQDLRRASRAFQFVAATRAAGLDFGSDARTRSVAGVMVTADYFRALGVAPFVGRFFTDDEAGDAPGHAVAVLSYAFWQRELAGDRAIIGQTIQLVGRPHTVIGVAPDGFKGVGLSAVDVWIPLTDGLSAAEISNMARWRQTYAYMLIARVAMGQPLDRAAEIATAEVVAGARKDGASEADLRANMPRVVLTSVLPRAARADQPESKVSMLLGAVSLFVLLLACANVMNLQLARGIRRRREIAVRLALGVNRARLVRQLTLDCLLLGLAGGAAGAFVAQFGGRFVRDTLLGGALGSASPVNGRVLLFSLAAAIATGLITGLVPAFEMMRSNLVVSLKEGTRGGGESRGTGRLRAGLLIVQAALTTVLLVGTGVFVLSLRRIEAVPLGFDPERVAIARLNLSGRHVPASQLDATYRRLEETARETPGVAAAALALVAPFEGSYSTHLAIPGHDSVPVTRDGGPYFNAVTPDFFTVMGTRFKAGRPFTASDQFNAPRVIIVNETAARLWWPNESALGKCIRVAEDTARCSEVVGVVANTRRQKIVEDDFVQVFVSLDQLDPNVEGLQPRAILFRASRDRDQTIVKVQQRLQSASAGLPFVNVRPLEALIAPRIRSWRLGATMFGVFGALALVLAAVGLYSVLAYDVAQRRHEFGVRTALGAAGRDLAMLIVGRGVRTVATGAILGAAASLAAAPLVASLLFRTSPREPVVFVAVGVVLAVVSALATGVPALRASRVDPSTALRSD